MDNNIINEEPVEETINTEEADVNQVEEIEIEEMAIDGICGVY